MDSRVKRRNYLGKTQKDDERKGFRKRSDPMVMKSGHLGVVGESNGKKPQS